MPAPADRLPARVAEGRARDQQQLVSQQLSQLPEPQHGQHSLSVAISHLLSGARCRAGFGAIDRECVEHLGQLGAQVCNAGQLAVELLDVLAQQDFDGTAGTDAGVAYLEALVGHVVLGMTIEAALTSIDD